ncbi:DUF6455 family protein [Antarctobacter jejuensis]|uniref:DUF6455 family protein n=1 Tax=Antarctobacter jejuensis TaxID=1439938 RepID=UPI003FD57B0D
MAMDGADRAPTRPQVLGDENEHYWLVQRMARATGVDLVKAAETGELTQEGWAGIVHQCRTCQWGEGCQRWLSEPVDETRPFPDGCINRKRLADLKVTQEAEKRKE